MSKRQIQRFLARAEEREKNYDWVKAAEHHEQALGIVGREDFSESGEIQQRIGYCFCRGAFQAETNEDFKKRMQLTVETYKRAAGFFKKVEEKDTRAKISHCKAMAAYVSSWLASDLSAKRQQLDECWRLEKKALKRYEKAADHMNVGKICNNLTLFLTDRLDIELDAQLREKIVEEALEYGEKAIKIFSRAKDRYGLAQAYTLTAFFHKNAAFAREFKDERKEECRKKALSYLEKAIEVSEEVDDMYLIGLSNFRLADARYDILGTSGLQERQHLEKALECGTMVRDHLLIALALWGLEYATYYSAISQEDPDKAREEFRKLDEYREDAIDHCNIIGHDAGIAMAYCHGVASVHRRHQMETKLKSKRLLIEKFVRLGYKGLEHAHLSGSMGVTCHMTAALGRVLICLARVETDTSKTRGLLEESAKNTEESINLLKQASACAIVEPREGNLCGRMWTLALNQVELASMKKTIGEKIRMLKTAITNMRKAREYWLEWAKSPWARVEKPDWFMLGVREMETGKTLNQLYALTGDSTFSGDSIDAFSRSVEAYNKANASSRVAEAHWQIAKTYNQLADYSESAKNFESASKNYTLAAGTIAKLKSFYMDYAAYMQAWSEIEKARHHHARQEYGKAKRHYEKAAELHKSTERWSYLHLNYLAWARLEEAEDLSRKEQVGEAKDLFQQAAQLFVEGEKSIEAKLRRIEGKDGREMLVNLAKASDIRHEYCLGRIHIEEARILDRKGDHDTSSRKYGSATEKFQKAVDAMKDEADRRELKPIVCLCRAWQMMTRAEAEASPNLYLEASRLFEEAKNHSLNEKARMLALGHSRFCKALEAGTKFEAVQDTSLYTLATQHLEGAGRYYLRAGFKNASEYAGATQKLLDAYLYMHNAKTETDPSRKTRFYMMAEKVLQASAGSYLKAKHPEKQEQVSKLLEKVRKERELALSLAEVLHAPLATSTTATFTTPTPTEETAIGLERFEHADIQANLLFRVRELKVGENLNLRIELVNAGKAPAVLIKVDEIIPENFEIEKVPEIYTVEDNYLNMKGKRLNPLKTEDVEIIVKPLSKGVFTMKPRILYIDETGKYKSYEPEPVTITVEELGIKGWIKGE